MKDPLGTLLSRVPWGKFLLLWFLGVLMGTSLLWLHYGFTSAIRAPFAWLVGAVGIALLWGTTRPRWQKAHCSWCMARVTASEMKFDKDREGWVTYYNCAKCGHVTEKVKPGKGA